MKIKIFALTALSLALTPFAFAQEESSTPAETPQATAPESSPSPATDTSVSVANDKSASPAMKEKSGAEATLREMENKWEASVPSHDASVAQGLLADDFTGVTSRGKIVNKSGMLNEIKSDQNTYTSAKNDNMNVRVYGGQFAVVTGTSTEAGKGKDGRNFSHTFRWTDTWVERNGQWQCVASQAMLVSK